MKFKFQGDGSYHYFDWCGTPASNEIIAIILKSKEDGYWRAKITVDNPLTCAHFMILANKINELNSFN